MAKKQSRRAVSLSRDLYVSAQRVARERGVSLAQLVADALRRDGVVAAESVHFAPEVVQRAVSRKRAGSRQRFRETLASLRRPSIERQALGDAVCNAAGLP